MMNGNKGVLCLPRLQMTQKQKGERINPETEWELKKSTTCRDGGSNKTRQWEECNVLFLEPKELHNEGVCVPGKVGEPEMRFLQ